MSEKYKQAHFTDDKIVPIISMHNGGVTYEGKRLDFDEYCKKAQRELAGVPGKSVLGAEMLRRGIIAAPSTIRNTGNKMLLQQLISWKREVQVRNVPSITLTTKTTKEPTSQWLPNWHMPRLINCVAHTVDAYREYFKVLDRTELDKKKQERVQKTHWEDQVLPLFHATTPNEHIDKPMIADGRWAEGSELGRESEGTICCSALVDSPAAKVRYFDDPKEAIGLRLKEKFRRFVASLQVICNNYIQSGNGDNDTAHDDDDDDQDDEDERRARVKNGSADMRTYLRQGVEGYGYYVLQQCELLDYAFKYMPEKAQGSSQTISRTTGDHRNRESTTGSDTDDIYNELDGNGFEYIDAGPATGGQTKRSVFETPKQKRKRIRLEQESRDRREKRERQQTRDKLTNLLVQSHTCRNQGSSEGNVLAGLKAERTDMENRVYYGQQLREYIDQLRTSKDVGGIIIAKSQIKLLCARMDIPLESMKEILDSSQKKKKDAASSSSESDEEGDEYEDVVLTGEEDNDLLDSPIPVPA